MPAAWIVLVDFNGLSDTRKCLQSLAVSTMAANAVVVDNASKVEVGPALQPEFPTVAFVRSPVNGGWAGGNNIGVKYAIDRGADLVILLNNDTTVPPEFTEKMIAAAEAHPDYGVLGPVIHFMDEPTKVQTTGVVFNRPDRAGFFQPIDVATTPGSPAVVSVDIVNGCCLMIRRATVEKIGLIDDCYFLIHEESDWCLRVQEAGGACGVIAEGLVWHKGSSSFQREGKSLQRYFDARNLLRLLLRHRRRKTARKPIPAIVHYLKYIFHRYAHEKDGGFDKSANAVLEGLYDGLRRRRGPYPPGWRPGLFALRGMAYLAWRLRRSPA